MPETDINHELVFRSMAVAVLTLLNAMNDEQRLELLTNYCNACGSKNLPCYCMRDD